VGTIGPEKINWSRIRGRSNRSTGTEKPRHALRKSLWVFVHGRDGPPRHVPGKTRWLSM